MTDHQKKLLHHLAVAGGFVFLILWFYFGRKTGFLDWAVSLAPASHAGAALTLAIMIMMVPAFFIWKYINRLVEKKLDIRGRYYEDDVYKKPGE
jgi:hypothetical protein